MGKIPNELRETIARNIRDCRIKKFPGRGGGKKCAEAFGVSPQQWSPWERGMRTPDELRLAQLGEFFGVSVEWLRRDNRKAESSPPSRGMPFPGSLPLPGLDADSRMLDEVTANGTRGWMKDAPGSPASFFWLAERFIQHIEKHGLRIDKQCLDYLAEAIRRPPD